MAEEMSCFGKHNQIDRICELCRITNTIYATECMFRKLWIEKLRHAWRQCEFRESKITKDCVCYSICKKTGEICQNEVD
jgi:hypothetical protein